MSSPSVSVSPIRKVPWLGMPTTSPAKASSASARSWAKKNCGLDSDMFLPVRTSFAFMPRVSLPEHSRANAMRSRWFGSMLAWILKTKALIRGSAACTLRRLDSCARGGGAKRPKPSSRSPTPKLRNALPKYTGVRCPSRNASRSNGLHASETSASSSLIASTSRLGLRPASSAIRSASAAPVLAPPPSSSRTPPVARS